MSKRLLSEPLGIVALVLVVSGPLLYSSSSLASRFVLVAAFLAVLVSLTLANYWNKEKIAFSMLLLASLLFLLWRSSFIMPHYIERAANSRLYIFAKQYGEMGHLVFSEEHSYFFLPSLMIHCLYNICGIAHTPALGIYISLSAYGILAALVGILILKAIRLRILHDETNNNAGAIFAPLVAFYLVSSAYSERSIGAGGFEEIPILLLFLAMWFLFDRGFESRSHVVTILLLVVGVTLGSTDGIMLLTAFFFLFSISGRRRTAMVYALIPLGYMLFVGYSYTVSLRTYATYGWEGFWEFLARAIEGQRWEKVLPWQRATSLTREDSFVASVTYLSLMLLSVVVALVSTFVLMKEKGKHEKNNPDTYACIRSNSTCLWLALAVATIVYVGASIKLEVGFSDIRTLSIVLLSWLLPFLFISRRLISKISAKKVLMGFMITLIVFASLRTIYEVYPKSVHDPINLVEDVRLGSTTIYLAANHFSTYYGESEIIVDYGVWNRLYSRWLILSPQYKPRWLSEKTLTFPEKSILLFNIAGIEYPSRVTPREAYIAAYSYSTMHNRLYDNGAVLITSHR